MALPASHPIRLYLVPYPRMPLSSPRTGVMGTTWPWGPLAPSPEWARLSLCPGGAFTHLPPAP